MKGGSFGSRDSEQLVTKQASRTPVADGLTTLWIFWFRQHFPEDCASCPREISHSCDPPDVLLDLSELLRRFRELF